MSAPLILDVSDTERAQANRLLANLNITQAGLAAAQATSRTTAAKATADALDGTPLGTNPAASNGNPLAIPSTPPPNVAQPDYRNPPGNPLGVVSSGNPLGL